MGIKCPVCRVTIDVTDQIPGKCPACDIDLKEKLTLNDLPTSMVRSGGMNTARAIGPGLVPLSDLEQTVY